MATVMLNLRTFPRFALLSLIVAYIPGIGGPEVVLLAFPMMILGSNLGEISND